ncbi:MAG: hypothetical protein K0Q76_2188 [Panacagrimonas sp.]|jgi:hypothetical protein|nr:hypothetical protein [Panacagrimonas sp.]
MRGHIAIRRLEFVAGTTVRPEVRVFTQTHATRHPVPWGKLSLGDSVYMKWTAGPIVAKARVSGFRQFEAVDAATLRAATYGSTLYSLSAYWTQLPPQFSAVVVHLEDEQWFQEPVAVSGRSYGESWLCFDNDTERDKWLAFPTPRETTPPKVPRRRTRTIPHSVRFSVFRRDAYTCRYCGRSAPFVVLHVDHVTAWSKGGSNVVENLVTACADCNLGKGASSA